MEGDSRICSRGQEWRFLISEFVMKRAIVAEKLPKQLKIKLLTFVSLAELTNTTKIYERFSRCQ